MSAIIRARATTPTAAKVPATAPVLEKNPDLLSLETFPATLPVGLATGTTLAVEVVDAAVIVVTTGGVEVVEKLVNCNGTTTTDTGAENENEDEDEDDSDKEAEEGTGIEVLATELVDNKGGTVLDDEDVGTGNAGVEELGVKAEAGVDEDVGSPGVLIENEGERDGEAAGAVDDGAVELDSVLLAWLLMDRGPGISGTPRA